jgi:hypothetical protein
MSASDMLQKVVADGQAVIQQQMVENNKMFEASIAQFTNGAGGITLDLSFLDPDLKEQFNNFGGNVGMQTLMVNIQIARRLTMTQLILQAAVAKQIGLATPATDEALKQS